MYDAEGMEYPPSDDDLGRGRSQNNSAQNFYSRESQRKSQNQPTKDLGIKHIQIGILSNQFLFIPSSLFFPFLSFFFLLFFLHTSYFTLFFSFPLSFTHIFSLFSFHHLPFSQFFSVTHFLSDLTNF